MGSVVKGKGVAADIATMPMAIAIGIPIEVVERAVVRRFRAKGGIEDADAKRIRVPADARRSKNADSLG